MGDEGMLSVASTASYHKVGEARAPRGCLGGERAPEPRASDRSLGPGSPAGRGLHGVRPGQRPVASERPGTQPPRTPLSRPPPSSARLGYLELSSAKWDPSPVPLTLQTAKHDSPPGRGNSVSLMRRRRLLLLLAGPLRLRGKPRSRGAAEGGVDAADFAKFGRRTRPRGGRVACGG